ncbi:MAG: serine hydroxymethyltransferase, partial [Gammaproteobacteria bacterium]|nr:serine hydroxymethyltransferase [Gammaproteobacteria bacterium]
KPSEWVGLRLGVAAATTRGLGVAEFELLGEIIAHAVRDCADEAENRVAQNRDRVLALCEQFPIYG